MFISKYLLATLKTLICILYTTSRALAQITITDILSLSLPLVPKPICAATSDWSCFRVPFSKHAYQRQPIQPTLFLHSILTQYCQYGSIGNMKASTQPSAHTQLETFDFFLLEQVHLDVKWLTTVNLSISSVSPPTSGFPRLSSSARQNYHTLLCNKQNLVVFLKEKTKHKSQKKPFASYCPHIKRKTLSLLN